MHVTESACEALSKLLGRAGPERCLRLSTVQGNYRFIVDEPIEQDILYRFDERVVLAVSDTVSRDLWGITVDCDQDEGKRKLIFRKAQAGEPLDSIRDDAEVVPPKWRAGEQKEWDSCVANDTWELVPRKSLPLGANVIRCKTVYKIKVNEKVK